VTLGVIIMRQSRLVAVMHVEERCVHLKTFDCTTDSLQSLAHEPLEILRITRVHWALSAWTTPNLQLLCPRRLSLLPQT